MEILRPQELRIGNYVNTTYPIIDKLIRVGSINHTNINNVGSVHFEPIPLTEEWLLKFGFSSCFSSDPQHQDASKKYELNDFVIHQPNENEKLFIYETGLEVKHVHQLQNLYFALTNNELTIK